MPKLFRVLSIDGGGIRGIIPARVLIDVEDKLRVATNNPDITISDCFDLIAGTSTGGILACVYLCPNAQGKPRFTAQEALDLYFERGDEIFDIPVWHAVTSGAGLLDEKYPDDGLEEALADYFGDLKLDALLGPCLVTAYDIKRRRAHFFKQHRAAKGDPTRNFKVRDVARATSAAPTFFECARVKSDANTTFPLVDGGVFANNPALCAYAEARSFFGKTASQMAVLSIGTGSFEKSYSHSEAKDWGLAGWAKPVMDIMMSGVSETVDFQLEQIYAAVKKPGQYLRIQPEIPPSNAAMDNAERENLVALRDAGARAASDADAALNKFVKLLV